MCYSAEVWEDYRLFVRKFGATLGIGDFYRLLSDRQQGTQRPVIPKGMELAFANPETDEEQAIHDLILAFNEDQSRRLEAELFKQKTRLTNAERSLEIKPTKKAGNDQRIATDKIANLRRKLSDLKRTEPKDRDNRIFPGSYAPVMISDGGQRVIKPMRYQCRPAGKPAFYDRKFPGTYNARRDNLEGVWKDQFGKTHGLIVVSTFYENVEGEDGRNQVLKFTPRDDELMYVACLWSQWSKQGEADLLSFAAITDEPPTEVAAAGHDRCIINIKPEHIDAWLNPDPHNLHALHHIFDDRARPFYQYQQVA